MMMPGRGYTAGSSYRYGFNGKEKDNEMKGEGNSLDFGARAYDPRLSRWLSIDPLEQNSPFESPYTSMGNMPILFTDPDGKTILISAKLLGTLLKTIDNLAMIAITEKGRSTIKKLHETNNIYIVKSYKGAKNQYNSSKNTLTHDPHIAMRVKDDYYEHSLFSLGHEMSHAEDDYGNSFRDVGRSEAYAVEEENYYRSVYGHKKFRKDYDFGWEDVIFGGSNQESFENSFDPNKNPNPNGESVKFLHRRIVGQINIDEKDSYIIQSIEIYDANAKEVTEQKNAIIYFFDYKKDIKSKVEKKAVVVSITVANGIKK